MTEPVLQIRGLSKTFPGQKALVDVDFEVAPGEVHALVGQNGSGKSTLIKILAGYHDPDPGATATISSGMVAADLELGEPTEAEEAGIRFVHQDLALVEDISTVENLALGQGYQTSYTKINWRRERRAARAELHGLGYDFDVQLPVGELSPADRTGVAIARALHNWERDVALIVLDEPTAAMPGPDVERLFRVIREVRDRGVSVVYVSHHLDEVFAIADRVTVLRDAKKVATVPVEGLDHDGLVELIVGKALVQEFATYLGDDNVLGDEILRVEALQGDRLRHLDLSVARGEILGVAGITGSGREEVARLLFGALRRSGGRVSLEGEALPDMRPDVAAARHMAYIPADRNLAGIVPEMTVRENVTLVRLWEFFRSGLLRSRDERTDVARWLDKLDVRPRQPERTVETLSGGNQQKVVLARWLRTEPKALVLDEPTQGVDVGAKADIHRLVDQAAEDGAGVVVCSTDTEELVRLCHRVVVLQRGLERATLAHSDITVEALEQLQLQVTQEAS